MLTRTFLVVISLFSAITLEAQEFLDIGNTWTTERIASDANGDPFSYFFQYEFDGTIQIDSINYYILKSTATDSFAQLLADGEAGKYYRAAGEQVYYKNELDGPDYLLFDMSVSVGDTLWVGERPDLVVVTELDSIILDNGDRRKRVTLEGENMWLGPIKQEWVEGIGNLGSTFNGLLALSYFMELQCLTRNGITEYAVGQCTLTSVHLFDSQPAISIYPNPTSDLIRIDSPDPELIEEILVYTAGGTVVLHFDSPYPARIDVSQLPPSTYFLCVLSRDGSYNIAPFVKH